MITIIDVLAEMKLPVSTDLTWSVGRRVRDAYRNEFGTLPPKELRPKTHGKGSHCIAVYPQEFKKTIKAIAKSVHAENSGK